jgi:hypothetical protein
MNRTQHSASFVSVVGLALCLAGTLLACFSASARAGLPDHRAFELVSPVEKGAQSVMPDLALADASGEHAVVDGGAANSLLPETVSWMLQTRTADGWRGVQVGPPTGTEPELISTWFTYVGAISEDFSRFLIQTSMSLNPRDPVEESGDMYLRNGPTGPLEWVSGPPAPEVKVLGPLEMHGNFTKNVLDTAVLSGASADLSHVVWNQFYPLVPPPGSLPGSPADTHAAGDEVYESVNGAAQLVGQVPATGTECGPSGGSCVVPPCGAAMGNEFSAFAPVVGAVSHEGSQVIFTSPDPRAAMEGVEGCGSPEVYVREDGASTLQASASQRTGGDPHGPRSKVYAGSAEEAGRIATVYFTSQEELTNESNTGGADEGRDLYAYSLKTGTLTDLTPDERPADLTGANVVSFVGAAADGARVYFTAHGVLAGTNAEGRAPAEGEGADNLYVYDASSGRTTFIGPGSEVGGPPVGRGSGSSSRVTPDGRHIALLTSEDLTAYKQHGVPELYLYDAESERLACVSCNPTGAPPVGPADVPTGFTEGGRSSNGEQPTVLPSPRFVSDDGRRVFFDSPDQLTPEVVPPPEKEKKLEALTSGGNFVPNAYEYEEGKIYLLAPAAAIASITPSGNDAFIDTFAQLTAQDTDGGPDIYDARVGGGFPLAPPACAGTSCQGIPAAAPIFATPSSATFSGAGNFSPAASAPSPVVVKPQAKPKRCKKGYVKKQRKCVKRHRAKKASHVKGRK